MITIQKKFSQLLSGSQNLLAISLAVIALESNLESIGSSSEKIELNNKKIEGIETKLLNPILFNKAKTTIHNWEGFK